MQGVVLAAGEGTRLRPLTADRPKALVEVADRPLLSYGLDALVDAGVSELIIVIGYEGEQLRAYYGDTYRDTPITYAEQAEPRGLADALLAAASVIDGPFIELHGDNIVAPETVRRLLEQHRSADATATLGVEEGSVEAARKTGVCAFNGDGQLTGLVEKPADPPSTTVLTGVFVFEPAILDACRLVTPSDRGEYELTDGIDLLLHAGHRVDTVPIDAPRINVNTPGDIDTAAQLVKRLGLS